MPSQHSNLDSAQDSAEYTLSSSFSPQSNDGYASEGYAVCGVSFIDQLPSNNSFKKPLKNICKVIKGLVRFSSATKRYIKTLQEV